MIRPETTPGLRRWIEPARLVVVLPAVAAVLVSLPLFFHPLAVAGEDTWRSHDWLESAKLDAYSREALLRWHRLPHWNPLLQGGFPQLAHPSDGSLSPLVIPSLLLGEALGMKLNVVLVLVLGAVGTALLGRDRWGLRPGYAAFAGCAYAVAGWVPSRVAVGFYESTLFAAFPFIAWLFLESRGRPWRLYAAAAMLGAGAMQLQLGLPMLMLALALITALELARKALPLSHIGRFALLSLGGACMAAAKVLPMVAFLGSQQFRKIASYPDDYDAWFFTLADLWRGWNFTVPTPGTYDDVGSATLAEFSFLGLGLPLALLILAAGLLWRSAPRGTWVMAVVGALFLWFSFGPQAPVDLFRPLWSLPVFHSMRGPIRYTSFVVVWAACPVAAAGLQALAARLGRDRVRWIAVLGVLALVWPAVLSVGRNTSSFTHRVPPTTPPAENFYQEGLWGDRFGQSRGGDPSYDHGNVLKYANLKAGIGTVYEPEDVPVGSWVQGRRIYHVDRRIYVDNPSYRGEAWCLMSECDARVVEAGPNEIVVEATMVQPDILIINQNWTDAWIASHGRAEEWTERTSTRVESIGPVRVSFTYRSPMFGTGVLLSLGALVLGAALATLWSRGGRRRPKKMTGNVRAG